MPNARPTAVLWFVMQRAHIAACLGTYWQVEGKEGQPDDLERSIRGRECIMQCLSNFVHCSRVVSEVPQPSPLIKGGESGSAPSSTNLRLHV